MPEFVPGLRLCELFYRQAVRPLLKRHLPGLRHTAARIDTGSEVLGFDTAMSTDHDWGPRLQLFLTESDLKLYGPALEEALEHSLPATFMGYLTAYPTSKEAEKAPSHHVKVGTIKNFFIEYLGFDLSNEIEAVDWLTLPDQKLRTIRCGSVFHDDLDLAGVRQRFDYYPHDVWLYLLAAGWNRIGQEDHLAGRAGYVGDEIGASIIASRLVRDMMRLCFLMERQYAPYPKWFGTAFGHLHCAAELVPLFGEVLAAKGWEARDGALAPAYESLARMHNQLGITDPHLAKVQSFYGRPFHVIDFSGDFVGAIKRQIQDVEVLRLLKKPLIGSIDQFSDSTDLLCQVSWREGLKALWGR